MGRRWRYLLAELGVGLRRNLLMTVATVVTVTVSLALLGAGLLVQKQVDVASDLFYGQVEVSIFLLDSISETQRTSLERDLFEHPVVDDVLYESKEDAYVHFQEIFAENESLLESVTPEILPASFRVKLSDPEQFAVVESQFAGYPGVDQVSDQRELLDRFFTLLNALRNGAVTVALLQLLAAGALIFNTIRVTAFARREQTGIMKLVGATNWYIRLPFMLEGIVAGTVGALAAAGLLLLGAATILSSIGEQIEFLPVVGTSHVLEITPILILIGAGIAAVASFLSLRRFLAV
jgi:cell division transport system permease protein